MRLNLRAALLLLAALAVTGERARACSCGSPPPPQESLIEADAVFTGTVTAIRALPSSGPWSPGWVEIDLDVTSGWKGVATGSATVRTSASQGSCGYPFQVGKEYVVHAGQDSARRLATDLCSRTRGVAWAVRDRWQLGDVLPVDPGDDVSRRLVAQLESRSRWRRISACNALALRPQAAADSVLALALRLAPAVHAFERWSAAAALERLGAASVAALPALVVMLGDGDARMGLAAARALESLGAFAAPAVPQMLEVFHDEDEVAALRARNRHDDCAGREERFALVEDWSAIDARREAIARAFGAMGPAAGAQAADAVLAALRSGRLPAKSARELSRMGVGIQAAGMLARDLSSALRARRRTLDVLAALGPEAATAVPAIVPLLADVKDDTRYYSVLALGAVGPAARDAVPALLAGLEDGTLHDWAAIEALAEIQSPLAAPALARAARDSNREPTRAIARQGLQDMGLDPEAVVPAPGKPREPAEPAVPAIRAKVDLSLIPRLRRVTGFEAFGGGTCVGIASHPLGMVGADFGRRGGAVLVDMATGETLARFVQPDGAESASGHASFGGNVAVIGTRILIAEPAFSGPSAECGAIHVFSTTGETLGRVDNPMPAVRGRFGARLVADARGFVASVSRQEAGAGAAFLIFDAAAALQGRIELPVGAALHHAELGMTRDHVLLGDKALAEIRIFERGTGAFVRTVPWPGAEDHFPHGMILAGLGPGHFVATTRGFVHVVDLVTGSVTATIADPDPAAYDDEFGARVVALDDRRFAVTRGMRDKIGVAIFDAQGQLLALAEVDRPEGDGGTALAIAGRRLALSASGHVHVFQVD